MQDARSTQTLTLEMQAAWTRFNAAAPGPLADALWRELRHLQALVAAR